MSTTVIAAILNILAAVLPWLGVNVGTEQLTTTVQTLVLVGTALWVWYQRITLKKVGKAQSDVNLAGIKK